MVGSRFWVVVAALSGFLCVAIGAMGSHSLPDRLKQQGFSETVVQKKLDQCEIGVKYQAYHSLAILALGASQAIQRRKAWKIACGLFAVGILLFSGGLYSMVFLDRMGHWSIVPLGGSFFMLGWLTLAGGTIFPDKSAVATGVLGS
jgi:uncharacterized membrane protein YgdD (TMEM256/DUF423 family)